MNKKYLVVFVAISATWANIVFAETQKVDNISYGVVVEQNQEISLANGITVSTGGLSHATAVNNEDGTTLSQWCRGTQASKDGTLLGGGGYCSIINQEGDMFWVWFGGGKWGMIGGTGAYEGATGGGTTENVSQSPDGRSFINQSTGKIKTK